MNAREFDYYRNLHQTVCHALLHLHFHLLSSKRFVPVPKRNELLLRYLKPKLKDKRLSNIKKDLRVMLQAARHPRGNLEQKLWELNTMAMNHKIVGAGKLYTLLVHLYDELGLESKLFEEGDTAEPGVLYLLADHIDAAFSDDKQVAPISMLIESPDVEAIVTCVNRTGLFDASIKEWNESAQQVHIELNSK